MSTAIMLNPKKLWVMGSAADVVVGDLLLNGSVQMISKPRAEVGFVAAIALGGVTAIANAWHPVCKSMGFRLELSGVFCHAAPIVKFKDILGRPRRCELADLLIVVDVTSGGTLHRQASLIQAKMARAAGRVDLKGKSTATQLELYQNWHRFDFEEPDYALSNLDFNNNITGGDAGTIGVIDRHFRNNALAPPLWTQHSPSPTPIATLNSLGLGTYMAGMLVGSLTKLGRDATPSLGSDWSRTVKRLLEVTYKRTFHHRKTLGPYTAPRGISAVACLNFQQDPTLARVIAQVRGKPPFGDVSILETADPGGVNLLHLRLSDSEEVPREQLQQSDMSN